MPETSYSSSEGEDDFFDANDDTFMSSHMNTPSRSVRISYRGLHNSMLLVNIFEIPNIDIACSPLTQSIHLMQISTYTGFFSIYYYSNEESI